MPTPPQQPAPLTLEQALEQALHTAITHHDAGQLEFAEQLYRSILQAHPEHAEANHNLGVLCMQLGQPEMALEYLTNGCASAPETGQHWISVAECLISLQRPQEAIEVLETAIQAGLDYPQAQVLLTQAQASQSEIPAEAISPDTSGSTSIQQCMENAVQAELDSQLTTANKKEAKAKSAKSTHQIPFKQERAPGDKEVSTLVALFNSGSYAKAEKLALKMTSRYPRYVFAWKALGAALQGQGRIDEALAPMQKAVLLHPEDAEAHSNLGVIFQQQGHLLDAEACYRRALEINPNSASMNFNLGNIFIEQGNLPEAEASYQRALNSWPNYADAHIRLGTTFLKQSRLLDAERSLRQALTIAPDNFEAHHNLGLTLQSQGRLLEAAACYRIALAIIPDDLTVLFNLGLTLLNMRQLCQAEEIYRHALAIKPDWAEAHNNLANLLIDQGRLTEAETCLQQALAINPELAEAHNSLGNISRDQGRLAQSDACLRRAISIRPDYTEAYNNLGLTLHAMGRMSDAYGCYQRALSINPNLAETHNNLGKTLKDQGRLSEAEASLRRALAINPDLAEAHYNLGKTFQAEGKPIEAEDSYRQALRIKPDWPVVHSNLLFFFNSTDFHTPSYCLDEAHSYALQVKNKGIKPYTTWKCKNNFEPLRVGLVSGDLRNHPVGYFLENLLSKINPERFKLFAYPTYYKEDELSARLRPYFTAWTPLFGNNNEAGARQIHDDGIHILLDLSGHTAHNRLPMFAWKPSPVQATWLGYFATTGIAEMDYILGDAHVAPKEEEGHFTETIWRLPETYLCFTPPDVALEPGQLPALTEGCITFGCFNNLIKMNDTVVALWAQVLHAVPSSRLFLKTYELQDPMVGDSTRQRFAAQGITANRLLLEGPSPREALLAAYNRVDITLDPFPYPGGTTSVESLWMGVPVITRRGNRFLSHMGESITHNAGLADWIAHDNDEYIAKAVAYSANLEQLAALRARLRRQVLASPLFDAPRFALHFESALIGMWQSRMSLPESKP